MRRKSDSVALRNEYILERIKNIKAEHPFWGYRRVWAYLRYIDALIVNKKRIYRLMRENNLTVKPNTKGYQIDQNQEQINLNSTGE